MLDQSRFAGIKINFFDISLLITFWNQPGRMVIIIRRNKIRILYSLFKNFAGIILYIDFIETFCQKEKQLILFIYIR